MDIKRLLTRGGQPFAAEIADGTETYNVFLESLGNSVILPELIKSGWSLTSLTIPPSLSKNGITLEQLPQMEYTPSVDEEMEMYKCMGTPMPIEERRPLLSNDVVQCVKAPDGRYVINTREDFIAYLESIEAVRPDTDVLPINYFVHPNALFSWEEFKAPENRRWVTIMDDRRQFTIAQFLKLRDWAIAQGLRKDFTPNELLSFYFQWGIDGLHLQVLNKRTEKTATMHDMYESWGEGSARAAQLFDFCLMDKECREYRKRVTEH